MARYKAIYEGINLTLPLATDSHLNNMISQ